MSNLTSDELHHAGRKGMKWGMNIFGRRQPKGGVRGKRGAKPEQQNIKMPKKTRRSVDERLREAEFRDAYRTRDNMSTKALKSKIARLEAEQRFKQLVEAPEKARLEALQKKKQARLAFIGKVGSAALDVYSKAPSSIAGRNLSGQAAKDAIEAFKKRQEWAKAFKDVPTTMTKFTQSINIGGVDVYIPESVQNRFMIQHAGRKGMKWGRHIFGDPNKRAFNKAVRGTRRAVKAFDKLQKNGRLRDNNILAESESINSVMTKGGVKYNPKIHNSAAMRDIKTIIRNNKILKDRTLGTDKDSIAIEKAANVLNYGSKGNKNSLGKLASNSTDSKSGLKRESRRLFKEVNSLNKDHRKGRISDSDYSKQLKEAESRQQKNSKLRGYDTASYSGKGMDPARRSKYNKDGRISRALETAGIIGPSGATAFAISRRVAIENILRPAADNAVLGAVAKGASFVGTQNAANAAINAALPSALSTIGGATTGVSLGIYGKRKYDEYNSQQDQGKRLFKTSAPSRYSKDKIDPNVRKSIISTINNHEHTSYSVKDQNGKETISANIKRYSKPSWDFSGNGPTFSDGIVSKKWRSGAINHTGVNMGEIINGVYIPSQDELLLHYGKKGMKWKKRKGQLTEEELAAGNDNPGGNVLREEERRYKEAAKNALNKVKGGIQDGKAKNKSEQKYLDQHNDAMRKMLKAKENADKADSIAKKNGAGKKKANGQDTSSLRKEESRYKKEAKDAFNKIKGGVQNGKAKNKSEQKYLDQHNAATSKMLKAKEKADKAEAKTKKKVKHSATSEDTLLHYGKKGMKWKKKGGGSDLMTPTEAAANEARVKKDDKTYNYNLKMRDEAIKNALKRGASGKEIRRLQDMRVEDQRKVDMNNRHKKALKNKDNRRSSYSREVTVADAKSGKLKTYKY